MKQLSYKLIAKYKRINNIIIIIQYKYGNNPIKITH